MVLVRWNPWQEMNTLQRQIDRLFEDSFASNSVANGNIAKMPAAEISETEDAVYLKLEVPGMEAKDLDVQVTEASVYVSGDRKSETKQEDNGKTRSEFYYGKFQRVIPLPARIQNTNVTAEYKNGILNLTLPKTTAEKNKVVKVNLEG
ncbi:Hsp20/alpha crystallin family protein [Scytonema millei]|uniref:Hsp20/alpha crystallin family protein n=1 Tax=Scytonema millei VB511283 TaxID=1245923 RepID=A0A9X5EA91_9CYAN|nr:Hsp20/alpha crystallin family protein [Scytonema millei]NHC37808.1 Hsp20/alpha crystallin family protein [Scytonema millei VB511283]